MVRDQLSLFVPSEWSAGLEAVRQLVDPLQFRLIPAHVTLCREDEIPELTWDVICARLDQASARAIRLRFGAAERFYEHGLLLPCIAGESVFIALRECILGKANIRRQAPHITLAHPRNPRAAGNGLANTASLPVPLELVFPSVRLIRQHDAEPWQVVAEFTLGC